MTTYFILLKGKKYKVKFSENPENGEVKYSVPGYSTTNINEFINEVGLSKKRKEILLQILLDKDNWNNNNELEI